MLASWGYCVSYWSMMYCGGMKLAGLRDVSGAEMAEW